MIEQLVRRLYAAPAAGDRAALDALLDPDLRADFSEGLPHGGGAHRGAAWR